MEFQQADMIKLTFGSSNREKKNYLSDFECGMVVVARFAENGLKKRKYSVVWVKMPG